MTYTALCLSRTPCVCMKHPENSKPVSSCQQKQSIRSSMRIKLKKALTYCDYTKEKDHKISEACTVLWDEIDDLSEQIRNI
uniref:Uncharacterized protein n=1 Tax=Pyramimonas orientalis virus TaxID=455367 RepID=A0A7M3UNQ8_POV01|nr:hypothetical protein HWQ62_00198 [Pyramimonas orientalis virus]